MPRLKTKKMMIQQTIAISVSSSLADFISPSIAYPQMLRVITIMMAAMIGDQLSQFFNAKYSRMDPPLATPLNFFIQGGFEFDPRLDLQHVDTFPRPFFGRVGSRVRSDHPEESHDARLMFPVHPLGDRLLFGIDAQLSGEFILGFAFEISFCDLGDFFEHCVTVIYFCLVICNNIIATRTRFVKGF